MNSILVIVISVVLSAIVSILIRSIDRSSNSKESVKKYADRRQKEFEDYFKAQTDNLKLLRSDLEGLDAEARAAVKKLEEQKAEFVQAANDLDEPIQKVAELGEKIDTYDGAIRNLMEMTAAVEENLQKVKDEADIIDKLNDRLDEQRKKVVSIDRQIPELVDKFAEANDNSLKHLGDELLEEYESRAQSISDSTDHAIQESNVMMNEILCRIKQSFVDASERASSLEDEIGRAHV